MSRDSIDPLDEFKFKPITAGLGFHRKSVQGKAEPEVEDSFQFTPKQFKARGLDLIDEETASEFKSPLPRNKPSSFKQDEPLSPTSTAVDEILKNLGPKKKYEFDQARQEFKTAKAQTVTPRLQTPGLQKTSVSLSAGFLDGMLITAGTLLGFIVMLSVTQVDLLANLAHPQDSGLYLASFSVFFGVTIIYYLVTRIFMGCSAGEWAYDQQLGNLADRKDYTYGPLIVVRAIINLATGIILMPLLSKVFGKDLVGQFIGLELYRNN